MSPKQDKWYWQLWGSVRKADPTADRHAMHERLGLPESHLDWNTKTDFDAWLKECLRITQPGNMKAQIAVQEMPKTRKLVAIGHLLDALQAGEPYALTTIERMNSHGRLGQPLAADRAPAFDYAFVKDGEPVRKALTLADLDELELGKVLSALKLEAKRRWLRKRDLLDAVFLALQALHAEQIDATPEVKKALCLSTLPPSLDKLRYDPLLTVLGVLYRLAPDRSEELAGVAVEDIPF